MAKSDNRWLVNFFAQKDVFILGGGKSAESITTKHLTELRKLSTIVMGKKIKLIPKPSVFLLLDSDGIEKLDMPGNWPYGEDVKVLAGPQSKMIAEGNVYRFGQVHDIISPNPEYLLCDHSGIAAVNAAIIARAKRIFLVGVDCGYGVWKFDGNPPTMANPEFRLMRRYMSTIPLFQKAHKKFPMLYRTTDETNLKFLPFMDLDVALADAK